MFLKLRWIQTINCDFYVNLKKKEYLLVNLVAALISLKMSDLFLYVKCDTDISTTGMEVPDECIDHEILGVNVDILEDQEILNHEFQKNKQDDNIRDQISCSNFAANLNDYTYCSNHKGRINDIDVNKENIDDDCLFSINPQEMFKSQQITHYESEDVLSSSHKTNNVEYTMQNFSPYMEELSNQQLFKKDIEPCEFNDDGNNFSNENEKILNSIPFYDPLAYLNMRSIEIFEKDDLFSEHDEDKYFSQNSEQILSNNSRSFKYGNINESFANKEFMANSNYYFDPEKTIDTRYDPFNFSLNDHVLQKISLEELSTKIPNENNLQSFEKQQNAKNGKREYNKRQKIQTESVNKRNYTVKSKKAKKLKLAKSSQIDIPVTSQNFYNKQEENVYMQEIKAGEKSKVDPFIDSTININAHEPPTCNTEESVIGKVPKKRGRKKKIKKNVVKNQPDKRMTESFLLSTQTKYSKKNMEKDEEFQIKMSNIQDLTNSEYRRYSTRTRKQVNYYYPFMEEQHAVSSTDYGKMENTNDSEDIDVDKDEAYEEEEENTDNSAKQKRISKNRKKSGRSKNGCWTCRLRRKKCPEERPSCSQCNRLGLPCDGYSIDRPKFMYEKASQLKKLNEIKEHTGKTRKVRIAWMHQRQKEKREKERMKKEASNLKYQTVAN